MTQPNYVYQGRSFSFGFTIENDDGGFAGAATYSIKRYPTSTAVLTGDLTYDDSSSCPEYVGNLTASETTTLDPVQYFIVPQFVDSDETLGEPKKIYVRIGWDV